MCLRRTAFVFSNERMVQKLFEYLVEMILILNLLQDQLHNCVMREPYHWDRMVQLTSRREREFS